MAAQKCKNILLQAVLKDFWPFANPKLKKNKFVKTLTSLESYWKKMQKWGFMGVNFVCKWFKVCPTVSFQKKAELVSVTHNLLHFLSF